MRKRLIGVFGVFVLAGCSSTTTLTSSTNGTSGGGGSYVGGTGSGSTAGSSGAATGSSGSTGSSSGAATTSGGNGGGQGAGILTAGMWDDSLNYDFFGKYLSANAQISGTPGFATADYDAARAMFAERAGRTVVDAALVIDTTGSMGDEIQYLTSEFANISGAIGAAFPGAQQRWALVVYRDTPDYDPGDAYVVQTFDFTSDLGAFAGTIGGQSANGGGDYPESPEIGLEQLGQLTWRSDPSVAKVAFWVGDAPQHAERGPQMKTAILDAQAIGVHLYPVSASGTDDLLELTMRSAAEITGGRYMFLTDDSGVGDPHKVPEIPCYYVTLLRSALVRAISMELSGTYIGPAPSDIIRVEGSPTVSGTCTTSDGQSVQIF